MESMTYLYLCTKAALCPSLDAFVHAALREPRGEVLSLRELTPEERDRRRLWQG